MMRFGENITVALLISVFAGTSKQSRHFLVSLSHLCMHCHATASYSHNTMHSTIMQCVQRAAEVLSDQRDGVVGQWRRS